MLFAKYMRHLTKRRLFPGLNRHPVDRWYSQYRFEHVEHRDGSRTDQEPTPFGL